MIPFNDLRRQNQLLVDALAPAVMNVIDSGRYVLGEEVEAFEGAFADYLGVAHCVGVASGTDALQLALMGLRVGSGDEVITAANTCVPTIAGIMASGATPVLADVDQETLTIDPESITKAISPRTRAIVSVHLYGHPCDMDAIAAATSGRGIAIVEDCAQAHGAEYRDKLCGSLGDCAAFSFYPTKNMGALGDGGAVVTDDSNVAECVRALRQYGRTNDYEHPEPGTNSRLDEIQAAVLRVKLQFINDGNILRTAIRDCYDDGIDNEWVSPMKTASWALSNHHLYVVRSGRRDALQAHLARNNIMTQIHYPKPIHGLEAYRALGDPGAFPVSERACTEILSLPLYPGMPADDVAAVVEAVNAFRP